MSSLPSTSCRLASPGASETATLPHHVPSPARTQATSRPAWRPEADVTHTCRAGSTGRSAGGGFMAATRSPSVPNSE